MTEAGRSESEEPVELNISTERVCFIIVKAREFDAKVDPVELDPGSNPADDEEAEVLEDLPDDATQSELREAINDLNEDETADLVALVWIGRGDFDRSDLEEARALARERHRRRAGAYLIGIPTLGDLLEEGLSALGHSCEEFEINRL
jgi:uncharacterized protein DUF3775